MKRYIPFSIITITLLSFSNCGGGGTNKQSQNTINSTTSQINSSLEQNGSQIKKPITAIENNKTKESYKKPKKTKELFAENNQSKNSQEKTKETLKEAKSSKELFTRKEVNNPLLAPSASAVFSFREALVGEPILAIIEFSEDVEAINQNSFEISGATVKKFDKVTPKLYRFVLIPKSTASSIHLYLDKTAAIDKDGNTLENDINISASIAKAPWAKSIRRYRGTIEATLSYKNNNSEEMTLSLLWVRPGVFQMGCAGFDETHCDSDETAHQVTLTKGFWLGRNEITQWQWYVVMQNNPSFFNANTKDEQKKLPVENISYDDAKEFSKKLLQGYKATANLPTEAQWEYAMRSSTITAYYDNPDDIIGDANSQAAYYIGWYAGNSSEWKYKKVSQTPPQNGIDLSDKYKNFYTKPSSVFGTHYIMQKANSDWRFKDMAGNVAEWCRDYYTADLTTMNQTDPTGPSSGSARVVKGGSWYDPAVMLRSASREAVAPETKSNCIGLRIAIYPGEEE